MTGAEIGSIITNFGLPIAVLILIMTGLLVTGREHSRALDFSREQQVRIKALEDKQVEIIQLSMRMMNYLERRDGPR